MSATFSPRRDVVMTDQPVEIERRGRSHVGLKIRDLRDLLQLHGKCARDRRGLLQARPFRHVHDHLEFALVVEREHLDDDQPK